MIGQRIAHYEIIAELGAGGMGVVYEAQDLKLHRRVAIKAVRPEFLENETVRQLFGREARIASQLGHPYVCQIFDVLDAAGQSVIVMEKVDGEGLHQRLARGPLAIDEGLRIALEIVEALRDAHAHGVLHRDIKPSNVILTRRGHVKVMDFGLARALRTVSQLDDGAATLSLESVPTAALGGTIGYMAPEAGRGDRPDVRADVFSLGVLLYEMFCGDLPFAADNAMAYMWSVFNDTPIRLRERRPEIPAALDELIHEMLSRPVEQRPASLDIVQARLQEVVRASHATRPARTEIPKTQYARSGDVSIAYQVVGEGPPDILYVPGWVSNIEMHWEEPHAARLLQRLASMSRLIIFDKRGTGLSDRVPIDQMPSLEQRMDDVRAVLDAVGSKRTVLLGTSEAGNMCMLFAATYPERTAALITFGVYAKRIWSADYPWAPTPEQRQVWLDLVERTWGGSVDLEILAPNLAGDEGFVRWWSSYLRNSASPQAAVALGRMNTQIDVRPILPAIRVPTLVMHRVGDRDVRVEEGRYIAAHIPGSKYVELPGDDHLIYADSDQIVDAVETFLARLHAVDASRGLATVLCLRAGGAGDAIERFRTRLRDDVHLHRGELSEVSPYDVRVSFDGPARAIRCARALATSGRDLGVALRCGLHTGECETGEGGFTGAAVSVADQIASLAPPGVVLVSGTLKDLVAGAGFTFEPHEVRGPDAPEGLLRLFVVRD